MNEEENNRGTKGKKIIKTILIAIGIALILLLWRSFGTLYYEKTGKIPVCIFCY